MYVIKMNKNSSRTGTSAIDITCRTGIIIGLISICSGIVTKCNNNDDSNITHNITNNYSTNADSTQNFVIKNNPEKNYMLPNFFEGISALDFPNIKMTNDAPVSYIQDSATNDALNNK